MMQPPSQGRGAGAPALPSDIQTEGPGLGGVGGAQWKSGARSSQHTLPGLPAPPLLSRQSYPPGGRAQALDLVNLRERSQPEPERSHAASAAEEGP